MNSLGVWKISSEEGEIGDSSKKLDQAEYKDSNPTKSYEKLGSAGIEGSLYQVHLLTMVLLNGLRKAASWRLSTEDKKAAQFDDLIFEYLPSESAVLLQAKHKKDEKKEVTYKDLMSVNKNSEFGLPKYFFSYLKVKGKFKVRNVVICTNLKLDKTTKGILKEERVEPGSVLHFEGAENVCYGFSNCSLPELKQNIQMYQAKNVENQEVIISDEDINDFLNHVKFFPYCLGDKNVETIVLQTISGMKFSENLNSKTIQTYIQKNMIDWFKEKKGRYLTEAEAKAFFCDMRSNKYCEELGLYDISFKNNNLPLILQTQQRNEKSRQQNENDAPAKRVCHIIPDGEYVLNVVKICQALPAHHKDKTLFVDPEETVEVQRQIVDAFEVPHYTILVMVCPNRMEKTAVRKTCERVMEILDTCKYKHVILIAEEGNSLATQLEDANVNDYEVITDSITFADLEETTQREFKRKDLINFQGKTMSLGEIFPASSEDDLNQTVNSDMLVKLARGRKSEVGLELPRRDKYYIGRSFNRMGQNILEEDLWSSTEASEEKIILISDSAGVGKSCVLTSLAILIKRDNPRLWVVRIDLNNYTTIMRTALEAGRKSIGITELLNSREASELKTGFERKLFATPKRVVLMLDGVDEISPTYTELVVNLIRDSLVQANVAKIFLTTRPRIVVKDFETIPELQSLEPKDNKKGISTVKFCTLEPFSKADQIDFLIKYWTETLDLQDDARKNKCNIYAEALIRKMPMWISERGRSSFAAIPLQTRMLAEIFQEENEGHEWEGCKEFSSSNGENPKLPTKIDVTQLYKLFIDKKFDIYIKKSNPNRRSAADEALKLQLQECQKFHRALALKVIFDSDERLQFFTCHNVERPIPSTFANNFLFGAGIVQSQGGNADFLHRTFAEYFTADCLLIELDREPINEEFLQFFMSSILVEGRFYVIRAFLDSRMRNAWHLIEHNFCSYFRRNRISESSLARCFQVCAEEGCAAIFEYLIECIDKEQREILSKVVNDLNLMYDALSSVTRHGHLNILKLLLKLNETFNKGKDAHKQFLAFVVIYSVRFNFLSRQVDKSILGCSAHHEAAFMGRFGQIELWMEETGMEDNAGRGCTELDGAVSMTRLEVAKFLVKEAGADVNVKNNDGETALHTAAYWGRLQIVKFLVEVGADINIKDDDGETALHRAAWGSELETVKFLVEEAGADINLKDSQGETALHKAAYESELELVKFLVGEARADVNVKNNGGKTALHKAAYWGRLQTVKFLVEAGADINVKDNGGETVLHRAALLGRLKTVKFLVKEVGADINIKDDDGATALHRAAHGGELETVKFLVREVGADINITDSGGATALHRAADGGRVKIAKFLVEEAGADINIKDNQNRTALLVASDRGHGWLVKFLSNSSPWVMLKMKAIHVLRGRFR